MPHLSPTTLTRSEQDAILRITAGHPRDHLIISMALGTGLRLAELVGLNVGDVFAPDGRPRLRLRNRPVLRRPVRGILLVLFSAPLRAFDQRAVRGDRDLPVPAVRFPLEFAHPQPPFVPLS